MATHAGSLLPLPLNDRLPVQPLWQQTYEHKTSVTGWLTSENLSGTFTDTQPIADQPLEFYSGSLLPGFADDFYNHIIVEPSVLDIGNLVSDQYREIQVFNGYFVSKELDAISTQDAEGISISGPVAGSVWGPLETKTYQVVVTTTGPASINAQVLFDFPGTFDDIALPIVGSRIVMLPYQAQSPMRETLEWKTNLLVANDGTEQRIRLRKAPRQSISASYPVAPQYLAKAFNMAYGWAQRKWAVPMWSQVQIVESVSSGVNAIYCDTEHFDFRANSLVVLWKSVLENEIVEIEEVLSDQLQLKRIVGGNYTNVLLLPAREGVVSGNINRNTNGFQSELEVSYQFIDNSDIATEASPVQFLGHDVYYNTDLLGDGNMLSDKIVTRLDVLDYEVGPFLTYSPWVNNKRSRTINFLNEGPVENWTFKQWLHRRCGRLRPYWIPTFENNLQSVSEGIVDTSVRVLSDDYKNLGDKHNHIAIQLQDESWLIRTVTGAAVFNSQYTDISIDTPLNQDSANIRMISFLTLQRLDTDRIDMDWIGSGISTCALRVLEYKP